MQAGRSSFASEVRLLDRADARDLPFNSSSRDPGEPFGLHPQREGRNSTSPSCVSPTPELSASA